MNGGGTGEAGCCAAVDVLEFSSLEIKIIPFKSNCLRASNLFGPFDFLRRFLSRRRARDFQLNFLPIDQEFRQRLAPDYHAVANSSCDQFAVTDEISDRIRMDAQRTGCFFDAVREWFKCCSR